MSKRDWSIFFGESTKGGKLAIKIMCLAAIWNAAGTQMISTSVITGSLCIPCGLALPVRMVMSGLNMLLPMITAAIQRSSQLFAAVKLEKHNNLGFQCK